MAVKSDRQDRYRRLPVCALLPFDRADRMLQRAVVQLHHVLGGRTPTGQATGQVDVNDVKSARSEPEVERFDVDDQLVPRFARPDHGFIGPGPAWFIRAFERDLKRLF